MMLLRTLLAYTCMIGVLCAGLIGGVTWLVQPGAAVPHEAYVAPIPPRIADSIERKKPILVKAEPEPAKPVEPAQPAMQEQNASLAPAPAFRIRELTPQTKHPRKPRERAIAQDARAALAPSVSTVTTARSDFPY